MREHESHAGFAGAGTRASQAEHSESAQSTPRSGPGTVAPSKRMLTEAVVEFFGVARSVAAASCNALRQPHATRCAAVRIHDDRKHVSVYLAEVLAPPMLRNLAETGRLAVQLSNPADHRTLQIKGRAVRTSLAPDSDRAFVEGYVQQLAHVVDELGISYERVVRMTCWPAVVVELNVEEIYLQTPGPGAGAPLGTRSP